MLQISSPKFHIINLEKFLTHMEQWQVRSLIRKAMALAEEDDTEDIRQMLEELESAEDERELSISQLQRDRDLLVAKVRELEQAMGGFL